jgi:MFS transporter, DHA1 family, solute carrier family 18 (vesicular amine transporter), member 1/2
MRRLLIVVTGVMLLETLMYNALPPLLPSLRSDLVLSATELGILAALFPLGFLTGAVLAALVVGRWGVKPPVIGGLVGLAFATAAFARVGFYEGIAASRLAQGVCAAGTTGGALQWLVQSVSPRRQGEYLGYAMGAAAAGAVLGPVLGAVSVAHGRASTFSCVAAVIAVLAAIAVGLRAPPRQQVALRPKITRSDVRRVAWCAWLIALPAMLIGAIAVLTPLRLDSLGAGASVTAATFGVSALLGVGLRPRAGRWSDRAGPFAPIRTGLGSAAVLLVVVPWAATVSQVAILIAIAMTFVGLVWAPTTALLLEVAKARHIPMQIGVAVANLAWTPGGVIGAGLSAPAASAFGEAVPFLALAAIVALTLMSPLSRGASLRVQART